MNDPTQSLPPPVATIAAGAARPRRRLGWLLGFLALALLAGLLLVRFYWGGLQARFVQLRELVEQARLQQEQLRDQLGATQQAFTAQQQRLQDQEAAIQERVAALTAQRERLADAEARLRQQEDLVRQALTQLHDTLGRGGQEWRVAEAAHLVELAAQRLTFDQDTATARQALGAAEARLRETGDPRWQPARERLAADLAALEAVRPLDRAALHGRLAQLIQAAVSLPPRALAISAPETNHWPDRLAGLESLVRIQRRDSGEPGAVALDRHQARQGLRLQLETARYALLRGDRALYDASLEGALTWLDDGFEGTAAATQRLRSELEELRRLRIVPELPDLSPTLGLLRTLLAGGTTP